MTTDLQVVLGHLTGNTDPTPENIRRARVLLDCKAIFFKREPMLIPYRIVVKSPRLFELMVSSGGRAAIEGQRLHLSVDDQNPETSIQPYNDMLNLWGMELQECCGDNEDCCPDCRREFMEGAMDRAMDNYEARRDG